MGCVAFAAFRGGKGNGRVVVQCREYLVSGFTALVVAFLISITAFAGSAAAFTLDSNDSSAAANHGYIYAYADNSGKLTITMPKESDYVATFDGNPDTELVIPDSINGKEVRTIAWTYPRFTDEQTGIRTKVTSTYIKTIEFPRTLKSSNGSLDFGQLYSVGTLTSGGVSIGGFVNLETIRFSNEGDYSFELMKSSYLLPPSLRYFNAQTIEVNGELVSFDCVIPNSVTELSDNLFKGTSFTSMYVPSSVSEWGIGVCGECEQLKHVASYASIWPSLPESVSKIEVLGKVSSIPARAFENWTSLEEFTVPDSVESIGSRAFAGCTSLESFKFGETEALTNIGSLAFNGATTLKTLVVPDSVTFIGSGAFANSGIESIVLPANLWKGMSMQEQGGDFNKDPSGIDIKDTTGQTGHTAYGAQLFIYAGMSSLYDQSLWNTTLKSMDLSKYSQDTIPYYMFAGCAALEEVRIPAVVKTLREGAFADCVSLKKVYLYNANPQIAGASSSGDTGDGSGGVGEGGWVEHYPSAFGYHTYADGDTAHADIYSVKTDLTLYGVGFVQNDLIAYAKKYGCKFIPFAFLGEGASSQEVVDLFGYAMPVNAVSVSDVKVGEAPAITLGYQDEGISRTLKPGVDCTIKYLNYKGEEVSTLDVDGTYTAVIEGDGDSVWGAAQVPFKVGTGVNPAEDDKSSETKDAAKGNPSSQVDFKAKGGSLAKTGDDTPVAPLAAAGACALAMAVATGVLLRRKGLHRAER